MKGEIGRQVVAASVVATLALGCGSEAPQIDYDAWAGGTTCGVVVCDDGDSCTEDRCDDGACSHEAKPVGASCGAGYCDVSGACAAPMAWSRRFGDELFQGVIDVDIDGSGSVIVVGAFFGELDFGGGPLEEPERGYVAKLNPFGDLIWSKGFDVVPREIVVGPDDSIVIVGSFSDTVDLGGGPLVSAGERDVFAAKLDASGQHLWSRGFGSQHDQDHLHVAVDGEGSVLLGGVLPGTFDFGGGPLKNAKDPQLVVAKLDAAGEHVWSRQFKTLGNIHLRIAASPLGGVFLAGMLHGSLEIGATIGSVGDGDAFLAKLDADGAPLWARRYGDGEHQTVTAVGVDGAGNVLMAGYFGGSVGFGGEPLVSADGNDAFLVKLDTTGSHLWSREFIGTHVQWAEDLDVNAAGDVVVGGSYHHDIDVGAGLLVSAGLTDHYVAKFDAAGALSWGRSFGNAERQDFAKVAMSAAGEVVLANSLVGAMDFGQGPLQSAGDAGKSDIFVAWLGP